MLYIYKFTNKINGKIYIGQTNNIEKRIRGHKSDMNNINSHSYNDAFHAALRKYGWDNFDFAVIEEIDDSFGREYLDTREKFFISYFNSTTKGNGYNITLGGGGINIGKKNFSECCAQSKILDEESVRDIQDMLINGYQYFEIKKKYPFLKDTFITNINTGLNFFRSELKYPLSNFHSKFSKETHNDIINMIKSGVSYTTIHEKYGISKTYISQINSGDRWFNPAEKYPLIIKQPDGKYSQGLKQDLIFTSISMEELAKKYQKTLSCIKAINNGNNRIDKRFIYPLRSHQEQNKKIWSTLF